MMKKLLLLACLALLMPLAGCAPSLADPATARIVGAAIDATGAAAPAPLASTLIDEKALVISLESTEIITSFVDQAVASGFLVPGSPRAKTVQAGLILLREWLPVASEAQRAGNAESYAEAMHAAASAFLSIKTALAAN